MYLTNTPINILNIIIYETSYIIGGQFGSKYK